MYSCTKVPDTWCFKVQQHRNNLLQEGRVGHVGPLPLIDKSEYSKLDESTARLWLSPSFGRPLTQWARVAVLFVPKANSQRNVERWLTCKWETRELCLFKHLCNFFLADVHNAFFKQSQLFQIKWGLTDLWIHGLYVLNKAIYNL